MSNAGRALARALNDRGFDALRLPRADFVPLTVLGRARGRVDRLGTLVELLERPPEAPPEPSRAAAPGFELLSTGGVEGEAGLSLLGDLLAALGKGRVGGEGSWSSVKAVELRYEGLEVVSVSPAAATRLIAEGGLDPEHPLLSQYLTGLRRGLLLVVEVLVASAFTLTARRDASGGGEAEVPLSELGIEAGGQLSVTGDRAERLVYSGPPMAVGFSCMDLDLDRRGRLALGPSRGPVAFGAPETELLDEGGWIDL